MHRTDNSQFLLYIELPEKKKRKNPINDALTRMMTYELKQSISGLANYSDLKSKGGFTQTSKGYRGVHCTDCGEYSTNHDYLLGNGMITNSLAPFYLAYYRNSIPRSERKKTIDLFVFSLTGLNKIMFVVRWILLVRYFTVFKIIPYRRFPSQFNYDDYADDEMLE